MVVAWLLLVYSVYFHLISSSFLLCDFIKKKFFCQRCLVADSIDIFHFPEKGGPSFSSLKCVLLWLLSIKVHFLVLNQRSCCSSKLGTHKHHLMQVVYRLLTSTSNNPNSKCPHSPFNQCIFI